MPPLFNLREWPLFRVARNVLGDPEGGALPEGKPRIQPPKGGMSSQDRQAAALVQEIAVEPRVQQPIGMSSKDRQAAAQAQELEVELANYASLQAQEEDILFGDSYFENEPRWDEDQHTGDFQVGG